MARQRWETESHKRQSGSARLAQEGILSFLSPLWLGSLEEVVPRPVDWGYITASGFGRKEIRNCGLVYARNASLRKRRNGGTAVALIPFRPGALVKNPRCRVIERSFEFVVTEILLEGLNVLIRGVGHRIGQKRIGNSSASSGVPKQKMRFATARSSSLWIIARPAPRSQVSSSNERRKLV